MELKLPSWELAKEVADQLPGEKSGDKPEGKPEEGKGEGKDIEPLMKAGLRWGGPRG